MNQSKPKYTTVSQSELSLYEVNLIEVMFTYENQKWTQVNQNWIQVNSNHIDLFTFFL